MKRTAFLLAVGTLMMVTVRTARAQPQTPFVDDPYGNIAQMLEDNDAHITPYVRRPIVEPHGSLRVDTIFDVVNFSAGGGMMGTPTNFTALFLGAGAGMGLLGDLEVGVMPLPFFILVDPDSEFEFGSIPLYGMYRFFGNQTVDIAGRLEIIIPTGSDFASFAMTMGVPVRIRDAKGLLSIDTGVNVGLNFGTCDFCDFTAGLYTAYPSPVGARGGGRPPFLPGTGIPLVVNFQPIDELFVGLRTGFVLGDFSEASNTQFIPLGLQAGYTLATSSNFMIDFNAGFNWPFFLAPGSDGDTVNADLWQITLAAEIHIDLFDQAGATAATTPPPSDPAQPTPIY